jgi:excinuclease ABC subunit A
VRGYSQGRFSFNVKGGRCEACATKRYNAETLEVKFKGKSIYDVLESSVEECRELFKAFPVVKRVLDTLTEVGLGYMKVGQPAPTLSGGEAQRVKLSRELGKVQTGRTLYVLDEPTTGLHMDDIVKLLAVLQRLVEAGNTVVVIEHNLDVIKCADWVIDLGPEGGAGGGKVVAAGTPEQIAKIDTSFTGVHLRPLLAGPAKNARRGNLDEWSSVVPSS